MQTWISLVCMLYIQPLPKGIHACYSSAFAWMLMLFFMPFHYLKLHNDKFQCYLFLLFVMSIFVYVLIVLMLCFYNSIAFSIIAVPACTCNAVVGMTYFV